MWKKLDKRSFDDKEETIGFWTPKSGETIQGKVKTLVETKKYPFFVLLLTEPGGTFTGGTGAKGNAVFLSAHSELTLLEECIGQEVRITYNGREKLDSGNSICRYDISCWAQATEDAPF
jgi:hypothetical protein